jgi:hypothetical protein
VVLKKKAHCDIDDNRRPFFPNDPETFCFVGHPADFGASVSLALNGNTAVVGAPGDNESDGAAWAFTRSGSTWVQQDEKLTGGGEQNFDERYTPKHIGGQFGASVGLFANGHTALIGGPFDDTEIHNGRAAHGAAWAYTRSGTNWTQQGGKLTGTGGDSPEGRQFGHSVALSSDGNTALIGGPKAEWSEEAEGAAWVLTRSDTNWTQQGERLKNDEPVEGGWDEEAGKSVALTADGNSALVGGSSDAGDCRLGCTHLFVRSGSVWDQQREEFAARGPVALSGDASTALVGTAVYVNAPHK